MTSEVGSKILDRLQEWEQREGQLPRFIQFCRELLQIQSEAKSHIIVEKSRLVKGSVANRLTEGTPLLLFEDLGLDWDQVQTVFARVVTWLAKDSEASEGELECLRRIARDRSLLIEVVKAWYRGSPFTSFATAQDIDRGLLASVVEVALKPFLLAYSRLLLPEVDQELWRRGYCPICGGSPDFACLDKERGARWLLCSRCDAEWLFQRLECPYCGTQDQNALAYFTDDRELYRLYVCERCRYYLKAIDLRQAESEVLLPLERWLTLDMDAQAQKDGYSSFARVRGGAGMKVQCDATLLLAKEES